MPAMGTIRVLWPAETNEHGRPLLWFASWLTGDAGVEGEWFYSGHGGTDGEYPVPPYATGVRIRRWPNEGLDAEYTDILDLAAARHLSAAALDFDSTQPFSRFAANGSHHPTEATR